MQEVDSLVSLIAEVHLHGFQITTQAKLSRYPYSPSRLKMPTTLPKIRLWKASYQYEAKPRMQDRGDIDAAPEGWVVQVKSLEVQAVAYSFLIHYQAKFSSAVRLRKSLHCPSSQVPQTDNCSAASMSNGRD